MGEGVKIWNSKYHFRNKKWVLRTHPPYIFYLMGCFWVQKMGWVVVLGQISSVLTRFSIDYIFETIQDTDLKIYI